MRVMVVDDNQPSALTMTWAIELNGYEVRTCFDGRSALEAAQSFHPDVVVLDLGMPEMDGYEVCRRLKANSDLQAMKIVAHSGWGDIASRQRTTEAGFDYHFTKPMDLRLLFSYIDDCGPHAGRA